MSGETLVEMREQAYDSEDLLQRLLAKYPDLLAGGDQLAGSPRASHQPAAAPPQLPGRRSSARRTRRRWRATAERRNTQAANRYRSHLVRTPRTRPGTHQTTGSRCCCPRPRTPTPAASLPRADGWLTGRPRAPWLGADLEVVVAVPPQPHHPRASPGQLPHPDFRITKLSP